MPMFDYFINAWLDAMVKAGFDSARWWMQAIVTQPIGGNHE